MKRFFTFLLTLLGAVTGLSAQVITADPVFPRVDDAVTIYFDATKGTGGLANCNCDVYIHTGLITSASTSPSDWKKVATQWGVANEAWKMKRVTGQANLYQFTISPSIRQFYGVGAGETVQKLAFVFRDATGSREGKDTGGKDMFYEVYPDNAAFSALLLSPSAPFFLVREGDLIPIRVAASRDARIAVSDNGRQVTEVVSGRALSYDLQTEPGSHTVEIVAISGADRKTFSFSYAVSANKPASNAPAGSEQGITVIGDTLLRLLLFAPNKSNVFVIGDFNDWKLDTAFQMNRTPDGTTYWLDIGKLTPGKHYRFQYLVDGKLQIADPFSKLVLDPANDRFISAATYPGLPPYPDGKASGIVTVVQPGARAYSWAVNAFQRPAKEKLVIYELLLRDFLDRHDYSTLIDTLDYLDRLGVNAIELMPVNEFEGNISWGYNPSFHLALDKYYGTANEFKRFVDSCHARGIAVILDVVFNHAFGQSPLAQLYWDATLNRPSAENPWLNPVDRHPFSVGYDFNHESTATRTYVDQALRYWLREFRVDGFRFDLSKGFTQKQTTDPNTWSLYDPSRITILKRYADVVWNASPGAYVIFEHFAENREDKELADYGAMLWGGAGIQNQFLEASMGYSSDLGGASYKSRGWTTPGLIAYMESHDEERMMYKNLNFGNVGSGYSIRSLPTALDRVELTSLFYFTIPGPKMLWQFQELGFDFSINNCPNGTVNNACRTDPKPIRWNYKNDPARLQLYQVMRELIHLKTAYPVFNTQNFTMNVNRQDWKTVFLSHPDMDVAAMGNFNVAADQVENPFPHGGLWYEFFSGDSLLVANPNTPLTFAPGEYRLYTTKRLTRLNQMTTGRTLAVKQAFRLSAFPNPGRETLTVQYSLPETADVRLELFDLLGRRLSVMVDARQAPGDYRLPVEPLPAPGAYLISLTAGGQVETHRFSVIR